MYSYMVADFEIQTLLTFAQELHLRFVVNQQYDVSVSELLDKYKDRLAGNNEQGLCARRFTIEKFPGKYLDSQKVKSEFHKRKREKTETDAKTPRRNEGRGANVNHEITSQSQGGISPQSLPYAYFDTNGVIQNACSFQSLEALGAPNQSDTRASSSSYGIQSFGASSSLGN